MAGVIIAMRGIVGSGKSTLARRIGQEVGAPVISPDCIGHDLFGEGYFADGGSFSDRRAIAHAEAVKVVMGERLAIFDRTHLKCQEIDETIGLASFVIWADVTCSDPAIWRARLAARPEGLEFWLGVHRRMLESGLAPLPAGALVVHYDTAPQTARRFTNNAAFSMGRLNPHIANSGPDIAIAQMHGIMEV